MPFVSEITFGGHVAACVGVIEGCENKDEDLNLSSLPNAMILFNPVLDTTESGYGVKKVGQARKTEFSPNHQVRAGIVPTILFHGTADKTVPFENAKTFARLMQEAGNQCQLESFEGKGHGFFNGKFFRPKTKDTSDYERTMKQSLEFLTALESAKKESKKEESNSDGSKTKADSKTSQKHTGGTLLRRGLVRVWRPASIDAGIISAISGKLFFACFNLLPFRHNLPS